MMMIMIMLIMELLNKPSTSTSSSTTTTTPTPTYSTDPVTHAMQYIENNPSCLQKWSGGNGTSGYALSSADATNLYNILNNNEPNFSYSNINNDISNIQADIKSSTSQNDKNAYGWELDLLQKMEANLGLSTDTSITSSELNSFLSAHNNYFYL